MRLEALLEGIEVLEMTARAESDISGISYDSRRVMPGDVFVAIKGLHTDGHNFIGDAIKRGATLVVTERRIPLNAPMVFVRDSKAALACMSANFFGRPSERLKVVGVTGTNGKTTTALLIKAILEHAGFKTGLIGTINYQIGQRLLPAPHTTPEAPEYQGLMADMLKEGCTHVVSEVSSHALALKRADCTKFSTAVFTNLTRDHLDFHKDMEDYFEAKKRLFKELLGKDATAVLNADDPYGRRLAKDTEARVITYGLEVGSDMFARDIINKPEGLLFEAVFRSSVSVRMESPLVGMPNVYNILASACAAHSLGIEWEVIREAIRRTGHIRGRFEKIEEAGDFLCVIDYAHTDDALRRLIITARGFTKGRIITVFGCGGERDRGKRPLMGRTATELSDLVFITSDNPRGEDPEEIIKDIEAGCIKKNYKKIPDRKGAIKAAVLEAKSGDTVLIAGKGHEDYQEVKGVRHHFSDREVALEALALRKN